MKKDYVIFILIILILLLPNKIWDFKRYLISNRNNLSDLHKLKQENLILKSQIKEIEILKVIEPHLNLISPAFVFSRYPFNLKSELLINLGSKDNIKINNAVVIPPLSKTDSNFIFIGRIKNVFDNFSTVQTIFDPNFKATVKIGKSTNALLIGGPKPIVSLIPKNSEISGGEIIYLVDANFPYGLILAEITKIKSQNEIFSEAEIIPPYDLNKIDVVGLIK
ncbi:MAG: rod shape-determining protein MreC [bacterium]|nr:rod shape-determining protein MreC [bacterium]